ncbi:hypothetical protein pb186bvf_007157 [Paramecium bursaria]
MLKSSLYEQCSEQIYCFAYGDSLHLRYITLYTSFDRLYVIAENKYNLTKHIQTIDWKDDSIIQMRFDTFKIHILTMNGQYSQLVLGEVFENNFKLRDKLQSIILKDVNFLPNLKPDGFTKFQDFVFYNKKILFLTQAGTLIQFEQDKQIISNIIYIRVQLSSVTVQRIDDREYFLGITEFNDLVKMTIDDQEPQFTRFADKNYSIKQLFITEKNLIILKENKQEVILAKYDILTLKLLKNYHLLADDQDLKFIDIQELPKIFVCQVFDQQNKIIVLSKKVMKFPYKKELEFKLQQLEDEQKNHFDLDFSTYNTAIISQVETKNEILHISKFKMQFGFKVTKQQVQNTLINCQQYNANLQILDSERSSLNNYFPNQALVITLTQIRIVSFDNQQKFGFEFKQLQQWENYCNTFNQKQLYPQSWQEKIKILMWNKVNQELGIEDYLKKKQETDQEMLNWVSSIQTNKSMQDQLDFDKDRIYLEQQYDKSLATIALLRFSNFSNEITISIIIYLVFKKQFPFTSEIIRQNSQQFLIFLKEFSIMNYGEIINNYCLSQQLYQKSDALKLQMTLILRQFSLLTNLNLFSQLKLDHQQSHLKLHNN